MANEQKQEIDKLSYRELVALVANKRDVSPLIVGTSGDYFSKVMEVRKNELSKNAVARIQKSYGL